MPTCVTRSSTRSSEFGSHPASPMRSRAVILAAVVVGVSGLLDSIDGAVAVLTDRVTRWGAVLDSVVDRVSDALYLVAFWLVGAPVWMCVVAGVLLFTQEYARARATAIGMDDVGVVTIWIVA